MPVAPKSIFIYTALLSLSAAAFGQASKSSPEVSIVRPGAPGEATKVLTPAEAAIKTREPFPADVEFMQGMIHHHAQAVEMTDLLKTRGKSPAVKKLGERISISQTDEIQMMRNWLAERGKAVPMQHEHMQHMGNHAGMDMSAMAPMPGMLTPLQMKELAASKGAKFDHLFLTGMIQHHTGALTMVQDLLAAGGAQDPQIFDFATDIENTQSAEINIMKELLAKEKK